MSGPGRIAITGFGAVCAAGLGAEAIWESVRGGRSAIKPLRQWDGARWPVAVAAEVEADGRALVPDRKLHKIITRTDFFGLYAAEEAVQRSGLVVHRATLGPEQTIRFNDRTGLFAGSGGGAYRSNYEFFPLLTSAAGSLERFGQELGSSVNPMWLLKHLPNNVLCHAGIRYGFKGTNACVTNQCVGGALALSEAAGALRAGEADQAMAVGHDAPIEPETVLHYHRFGLLSPGTLQPFDRNRQGTVFGEGAAALVLERWEGAEARGATILGEYLGSGCVTEATGIVDVCADGDGVTRAVELALADAGVTPREVGLIIAHANGTRASDASETAGIRRVFGDTIPPVTGFKWACGHLIAASGVLDVVLGLSALRARTAPGIGTLQELDPGLAPFPVAPTPQPVTRDVAVSISRGFGGMNVALVFRAAASPVAG